MGKIAEMINIGIHALALATNNTKIVSRLVFRHLSNTQLLENQHAVSISFTEYCALIYYCPQMFQALVVKLHKDKNLFIQKVFVKAVSVNTKIYKNVI